MGNLLEKYSDSGKEVLSESVTSLISSVLSDNEARTPAYGSNSALYFVNDQWQLKQVQQTIIVMCGLLDTLLL